MKHFYEKLIAPYLVALVCFLLTPLGAVALQGGDTPCQTTKYLYWVGDVDNDFFNEMNWRETVQRPAIPNPPGQNGVTGQSVKPACLPGANKKPNDICLNDHDIGKDKRPVEGTLTPGQPINYNLYIEGGVIMAPGEIVFSCADLGVTMQGATLTSNFAITKGIVSLGGESTVKLKANKIPSGVTFDFLDAASWVYLDGITPEKFNNLLDSHIKINGLASSVGASYRVNQYYQTGSLIRPKSGAYSPLTIFSEPAFAGKEGELSELTVYKGAQIPNGMNDVTKSFILKRGYMATFAIEENGTSKSKVYIASEEDLKVDALPLALQENVSFIRVVPWNWVTKKGTGGFYDKLDAGWFYSWSATNTTRPNYEYVPMAWGAGGASPAVVQSVIDKENVTHFLGFNESDNCSGESGQYNNLCQPEVAVAYYEGLMASGLRLGSPAPRENGPTTWLKEFYTIAKKRDVRFDFVAVHWYDWGSNPASTPNADPQVIFNRFKNYLENVYSIYQMPIWITEFNANPNRGNDIQQAFLKLALPYLESLPYVERYGYFQPNPNFAANPNVTTSNYYDAIGNLTNIGAIYLNHSSTPSIKAATYAPNNSLEGLNLPFVPKEVSSMVFEAECGAYLGSQWDILEGESASNGLFLRGNPQKAGASPIAKQVHFDFELIGADDYRVWIRASSTAGTSGALRFKIDNGPMEQIVLFNASGFTWFQVPRIYDLGEGKHRLTLEFPNAAISLDQVAILNGSMALEGTIQAPGYCLPKANNWGLEQSDLMNFYEAESALKGSAWATGADLKAINGSFIKTAGQSPSLQEVPQGAGIAEFVVEVATTDEYEIWAKIQALEMEGESSLWISVDDQPFRKWAGLQNNLFLWYWKKVHYSFESENRSFSYFLEAGQHKVRIAYASGNVAIDRLALASKGKKPADVDPDVVNLIENLEVEAELATILGSAAIVDCATSSNGKQVNLGSVNSNGVLFSQLVALEAGAYTLQVSYMSAGARNFRLQVNGVILGRQSVVSSGNWCFDGGSPGMWQTTVTLKEGVNQIQITPFDGAAPFIDKIKLVKSVEVPPTFISLEAEDAEAIGTVLKPACAVASNGRIVNLSFNVNNGIRFNAIEVPQAATYNVAIHYYSAVPRVLRIITNGTPKSESFEISGAWCTGGGLPAVKTVSMTLMQGENTIQLTPISGEAPLIDKIAITNQEAGEGTLLSLNNLEVRFNEPTISGSGDFNIYPNPVKVGESLNIKVPGAALDDTPIQVSMTDMTGRTILVNAVRNSETHSITPIETLQKGLYVIKIQQDNQILVKKIIVQ